MVLKQQQQLIMLPLLLMSMTMLAFFDRFHHDQLQPATTPVEEALQSFMHSERVRSEPFENKSALEEEEEEALHYKATTISSSLPTASTLDQATSTFAETETAPRINSNKNNKTTLVVFYNAFVPVEKNAARIVRMIIQEQLRQVLNSSYTIVYYNLIGSNVTTTDFCIDGLDCNLLRHLEHGNEVDTLQDLYEYCVNQHDDDDATTTTTVVYLHDKGSYHKEKANRKMRRIATKAALSDACRRNENGCNVCASRQQLIPHWHAPSNMWAAKCNYIRTLIPPRDYEKRRQDMFLHLLQNNNALFPCLDKELLNGVIDNTTGAYLNESRLQPLALGRYAYETWVYSGPTLNPCHVVSQPLSYFKKGLEDNWTPEWIDGPGVGIGEYRGMQKLTWFHKQGRLWEMAYLYNGSMPNGGWFWKAYRRETQNAKATC